MLIARIAKGSSSAIAAGPAPDQLTDLTAGGAVNSVADAVAAALAGELDGLVAAGEPVRDPVTLLAPVDGNARILCAGFNFTTGATPPTGDRVDAHPTLFVRFPSSLVGPGEPIVRPRASERLDWEGEVAAVIGRAGRRITEDAALDHVAGYVCFGDHSVRDFQRHGTQATAGKNFDGSGAIGPWIVTADALAPVSDLEVRTRLNGEQVQHGQLSRLVFSVPALIAYVSTFMALRPGDVIATGTPPGIGAKRQPPRWMSPGDRLEVDVVGVGVLANDVIDDDEDR